MQCFVINLASDGVRRQQIVRQLEVIGLPHEVFPAVYGKGLSREELARDYDAGAAARDKREMTLGEVGCALSHQGIYRRMLERQLPCSLVLEDDARLDPGITPVLAAVEALLMTDKPLVVLLNCVKLTSYWSCLPLCGRYIAAPVLEGAWGAHGYALNQAAARSLLKHLYPVRLPADIWDRFRKEGLVEVRAVVPYCIGLAEVAQQSTLGDDRASPAQSEKQRAETGLAYLLHRYFYRKFVYQILVRPFIRKQSATW